MYFHNCLKYFQAICCEHFTCIDLNMIEVVQEGGLLGAASDEDTLKKKFKSTAQIAALLSSGSSSGSVASAMERKSSGKRSTGTKKSSGTDLKSTTQDDAKGFDIIFSLSKSNFRII